MSGLIGLIRRGKSDRPRPPLRWRLTAWVLGLLGIVAGALGLHFYTPLDDLALMPAIGAAVGVGLWLLCVVAALVCKRLGVHDYPVLRLFDAWTALALLMVGVGATTVLNGALDPHGLEGHDVVVISRHSSSGGGTHGGRSYGVKIADFRGGHEGQTLDLSVSEAMYRRIKEGDKLVLMAGPGLVDWWHSGVRMPGE